MLERIRDSIKWWLRPIKEALLHFNNSDGWAMASHVALSIMIAIFPFLIFAVSLTGLLGEDGLSEQIVHLVFDYWPDTIAEPIVNEIEAVVATASKGFMTALIFLFLMAAIFIFGAEYNSAQEKA